MNHVKQKKKKGNCREKIKLQPFFVFVQAKKILLTSIYNIKNIK